MDIKTIPPQVIPYLPIMPGLFGKSLSRTPGKYYGPLGGSNVTTTSTAMVNKIYAVPFLVLVEETFDRISITIQTAAAGNARLGVYRDNGYAPGSLLVDAGEIDTGTTGDKEIVINQILSPGLYWLAIIYSAAPKVYAPNFTVNLLGLGSNNVQGSGNGMVYLTDQAYGALPDPHPTPVIASATCPGIVLRKA